MKGKGFTPLQIWGKKAGGKFVTGFTLIEILIVTIVLGILATMATAFFSSDYNKQKKCIENLEKISKAIEKYRDERGEYPPDGLTPGPDTLKGALNNATYILDASVFNCPADPAPDPDLGSYSKFYVKRNDYSSIAAFTLGCPRHDAEKSAMNLFFQGQAIKQKLAKVTVGGTEKVPGEVFTANQVVVFSDNSTATINKGSWMLVQSFATSGGKCYSLLRSYDLTADPKKDVTCDVTPGSKFEVITPSAIAGVGGTTFRVVVGAGAIAGTTKTAISVSSGVVTASDRHGKRKVEVKENDSPVEFEDIDDDTDGDGSILGLGHDD